MGTVQEKKTAAEILIERFLKDVDEKELMPWQRPYERYNAFNYFTMRPYRGFNRLMLPFGEYMTRNQITQYNKDKGYIKTDNRGHIIETTPEAYRFQKGIVWLPVVFFKVNSYKIAKEEVLEKFPNADFSDTSKVVFFGRADNGYMYLMRDGVCVREKNILRYYEVAERQFFRNANGEMLPSRIESGEVVIEKADPKKVVYDYVHRAQLNLDDQYLGTPCYIPNLDKVCLNPHVKSEDAWFSIAFHELGHSTGAAFRLNREGVTSTGKDESVYAKEECIAEICACLCCAETGIIDYCTSGSAEYDNNIAYVQAWKKRVKDWGKDFIYIVSQADKAFNYICNNPDSEADDEVGDD